MATDTSSTSSNFIRTIVENDLTSGAREQVVVRFPPEPNGFPHIGHAKSIGLNFGLANDLGGRVHLRFDDTNPETEDTKYVEAIKRDVQWLGFQWDAEYYASDYFEQLFDWAVALITKGKAYVDDLDLETMREYRGTVTEAGRPSPYRDRSVAENLTLFERMKKGEFEEGHCVLRAKIDMASPNMLLRDPIMYRIRKAAHYRRGTDWCIYPTYDWAHGQSDAIEGITHSVCTLEFEVHRPLYDWFLEALDIAPRPHQYEFARGNVDYTVMSKRKLLKLVEGDYVNGWDDPRMPTISGMRRRGVRPEAINGFWEQAGITRTDSRLELSIFEHAIRNDLNYVAPRVMGVLDPLKVVITNYPEGESEDLEASYWPHDIPKEGTRAVPFSRTLYIERTDFQENPHRKFYRLAPGREVRLRYAYIITCEEVVKDENGEVVELRCTYDVDTKSGGPAADRKVKGTIHWVSAEHAVPAEVRLYDRLFGVQDPNEVEDGQTFIDHLNPDSLQVTTGYIEPSILNDPADARYQFERNGYFWQDPEDSSPEALVFNRIITLRDSWAKIKGRSNAKGSETDHPKVNVPSAPKPKPAAPTAAPVINDPVLLAEIERYTAEYGLPEKQGEILGRSADLSVYFHKVLGHYNEPKAVAGWVVNEIQRVLRDTPTDELAFSPAQFADLVRLSDDGTLTSTLARQVFELMLNEGGNPSDLIEQHGLKPIDTADVLTPMIDEIIAANPGKVEAYRGGRTNLIGFFMGQAMRQTGGKADPGLVRTLLIERLDG
ncbi:MAG: glutamine--tRNA ligase/YqeY domain fusion protein [Bacteroidota bacterium]